MKKKKTIIQEGINEKLISEPKLENELSEKNKEKQTMRLIKRVKTLKKYSKVSEVVKTGRFWRLSLSQFFMTFSYSFILGSGRTFGALIGINGNVLQYMMLLNSGVSVILGPVLGYLIDKNGPLIFLKLSSLISMVPGILLAIFMQNSVIFITSFAISIISIALSMGATFPYIMEVYGIQESVMLGGIIIMFSRVSDAIITIVAFVISLFYDKEGIMKIYRILYIIGSGCGLIAFILLLFEKFERFRQRSKTIKDTDELVKDGRFTEMSN